MLESVNPFSDPNIRKTILAKEGIGESDEIEEIDEQSMGDADNSSPVDFKSLVSSAPKIPKVAKNMVMDAAALARNEREDKARELSAAINTVFSNYNKKYGTDLQISLDDLSKTLVNVSDPDSRRVLELYVSEVFKSVRPVLLLHVLQKLTLALDYALAPERLFDSSQFSAADSVVLVEKLMNFVIQIQDMIKEIEIPNSDDMLKRLADEGSSVNMESEENRAIIEDFMKLFTSESNKK